MSGLSTQQLRGSVLASDFSESEVEKTKANIIAQVKSGKLPPSTPETLAFIEQAKTDSINATSERLYIVEPRSARNLYAGGDDSYNKRGDIASIRLITTGNILGGTNINLRREEGGVDEASLFELVEKGYDRFLLAAFDVSYSEKTQIMTTFGDNEVVYYFGKNPVIMNLQGLLIDSLTNDWFSDFIKLYNTFLRGTQLAKNFEMIELVLPNMKVTGSIISLSHQQNSARDTDIPFSLQFYAKKIEMLPKIVLNAPIQNITTNAIFSNTTFDRNRNSQGASLASGTVGGFSEPTYLAAPSTFTSATSSIATGYTWFRNNIVSPVVSVIASLTRIIQIISKDITKLVSSFTDPLNAILRDVMSISVQANAVASLIESKAAGIGRLLSTPGINLRNTLSSLKNTAGVISRLPENVSSAFKKNYRTGRIKRGAAILSSGSQGTIKKTAVLSSGAPYTAQNSFVI